MQLCATGVQSYRFRVNERHRTSQETERLNVHFVEHASRRNAKSSILDVNQTSGLCRWRVLRTCSSKGEQGACYGDRLKYFPNLHSMALGGYWTKPSWT